MELSLFWRPDRMGWEGRRRKTIPRKYVILIHTIAQGCFIATNSQAAWRTTTRKRLFVARLVRSRECRNFEADFWKLITSRVVRPSLDQYTQWIYQNSMLMSWPETTENTNVLLMTQGFRNDLSFCSWPQKKINSMELMIYSLKMTVSLKWKKILGSGTKRKVISESLGH